MKKWKHFTAIALAGVMALSTIGCGNTVTESHVSNSPSSETSGTTAASEETTSNEFDWLDTSGNLPIVSEGTEKTLSIYFLEGSADSGDPTDSWLYQFIEEHMNINLEVTTFSSSNRSEFLSLAFASDELPDIIIGAGFTTTQLMNYGASEGQIIDLAPYLNETYMPNLYKLYSEHQELASAMRDMDGHVWSTGYYAPSNSRGSVTRAFLNYDLLEELQIPVPTTLDEFIDACRAVKTMAPESYPIGGSESYYTNIFMYILNALGYVTNTAYGTDIALRNGEVVLPIADREAYGELLKVMNTLYEEGLIHPDFYTMDKNTSKAVAADPNTLFLPHAP